MLNHSVPQELLPGGQSVQLRSSVCICRVNELSFKRCSKLVADPAPVMSGCPGRCRRWGPLYSGVAAPRLATS